ncbi:interferon-inducible GTPase 5-like [Anolis sagrei]|uniref:interferon-inducible GTPase 5-like n=1 Tax=Anolis sagrei TaxID=38937 RepID=UPI003522483A
MACCEAEPAAPSPWLPEARVGFVGARRGSGASWLVRALSGQPLFPSTDAGAFFRRKDGPPEGPAPHRHFPQLALHDLGALPAPAHPPLSLPSFRCLVLVAGPEDDLGGEGEKEEGSPLRALRRAAPRAALLLVRSGADAQSHTQRRRAGLWGRGPQEEEQEEEWQRRERGHLEEALRREGLDPRDAFLLSALQPHRYDFARFEHRLVLGVLGLDILGRGVDRSPQDLSAASWKRAEELFQACQPGGLLALPATFRSTLEEPASARLEVALVGEAGPLKSSLLRALLGEGEEEEEEEGWPPWKARPLPGSLLPRAFLRDVSGGPPLALHLSRFDLILLVCPQEGEAHQHLMAAVTSAGKEAFLIRSQAEAQEEKEEEGKGSADPSPRAFLLPDELPLLLEALQSGGPGWKRQALRSSLPEALSLLVAEKAGALRREAWERALGAIPPSCPPQEAAAELLAALGGFRRELGLEEAFLEGEAGMGPEEAAQVLQAEARSPFAHPMAPEALLGLVAGPPSLASWAWSFVPFFGWGAQAEGPVPFADAYRVLQRAVTEMAEDAERVLRRALLKE